MDRIRLMQTYVAVMRSGSLSAAAGHLGVSRAIVSKHILQLEEHIGARLLNRTTRSLGPTEIGIEYFEFCQRLLTDLEEMELGLRRRQREARGLIKVLVPSSLGLLFIGPAVQEFTAQHPQMRISLLLSDTPPGASDLFEMGMDLVMCLSEVADSSVIARCIGRIPWVACATPKYLASHPAIREPGDLKHHSCLVHLRHAPDDIWHFKLGNDQRASIKVSGWMSSNNAVLLREAVLVHQGVAFLPEYVCYQDLRQGRLRRVLAEFQAEADRPLYILYPHRRFLPWKTQLFIEFLAAWMAEDPYAGAAAKRPSRSVSADPRRQRRPQRTDGALCDATKAVPADHPRRRIKAGAPPP
ncbi:MAG: LysR family transcriptional regulator [Hyphomicrobiales bacterium]|nr:LysR family transcriptional regulator [Hyphomicrobiales bacterium]